MRTGEAPRGPRARPRPAICRTRARTDGAPGPRSRWVRRTAARRSPTARRSGPRPRTTPGRRSLLSALAPALARPLVRAVLADHRRGVLDQRQRLDQRPARPGRPGRTPRPRSYASADRIRVDGVCIRYPPGVGARAVLAKDVRAGMVLAAVPVTRGGRSVVWNCCVGDGRSPVRVDPFAGTARLLARALPRAAADLRAADAAHLRRGA